jgi:mRNA interferase MazF
LKEGDIAIAPIQQADGQVKARPVLLLKQMPSFGDWLVCGISTHLEHEIKDFDIRINQEDLGATGLKTSSLIRLSFLGVIAENQIKGVIGSVSNDVYQRLISNLTTYLQK